MATFNPLYLYSGSSWNVDEDSNVVFGTPFSASYTYLTSAPFYYAGSPASAIAFGFESLSTAQMQSFDLARTMWSAVSGITWSQVVQDEQAQSIGAITFGNSSILDSHIGIFPDPRIVFPQIPSPFSPLIGGDIWFSTLPVIKDQTLNPEAGNEAFHWILHEIGHAFGLSHDGVTAPTSDPLVVLPAASLPKHEANYMHTVMAYAVNPATGAYFDFVPEWMRGLYPITPMLYDIAQMQRLYGAASSANGGVTNASGNTVWAFSDNSHPFVSDMPASSSYGNPGKVLMTLWDPTGTQDAVDASGMTTKVLINLRPGEFSAIGTQVGKTGAIDITKLNVGIAFDAVIEDAFGGAGDDEILGNQAINVLEGRGGKDTLDGGMAKDAGKGGIPHGLGDGQADRLIGGQDADTYIVREDGGLDEVNDDGPSDRLQFKTKFDAAIPGQLLGLKAPTDTGSIWRSADDRWAFEKVGTSLKVSDAVSNAQVMLLNFADGDYGIRLIDAPSTPLPTRTIRGDLQPQDVDPAAEGIQTDVDPLGNVLVTGTEEPNRVDALFDSTGSDLVEALGGNDTIRANRGGGDRLSGGAGRDTIEAGSGSDLIEAGEDGSFAGDVGGDIVDAGAGDDQVYADGKVTLAQAISLSEQASSGLKGDFLFGGLGNDWLVGGRGEDQLNGGAGHDVIVGGAGNDTVDGDVMWRADTLLWTRSRNVVLSNGRVADFVSNTTGIAEVMPQGAGDADVIYGGAGEDWIYARGGDDYVDTGSGDDIASGNEGADVLVGGAGTDVLLGDSGEEFPEVVGNDYLDGGDGTDTLWGNAGADILVGGTGNDDLLGGTGDDVLWGGGGNDTLIGGAGKDTYVFKLGDGVEIVQDEPVGNGPQGSVLALGEGITRDQVKFGTGSLTVDLGGGDEIHFEGFDSDNPHLTPVLSAIQFADGSQMSYADVLAQGFDLAGAEGDDLIVGTGVTDRIDAGAGHDTVLGRSGDDLIEGGLGDDALHGEDGGDLIRGGEGADTVYGGEGEDALEGGGQADSLAGGNGADVLAGGGGDDLLEGESGDDAYAFSAADGADRIVETGGTDALRFDASVARADVQIARVASGDLLITYGDSSITVVGQYLPDGQGIESVQFADGSQLSAAELSALELAPVTGTEGADSLAGGIFDDTLVGLGGDDSLAGATGNDLLVGGAGNDLLDGGEGNDALQGGEGADSYAFRHGMGSDTVTDAGGVVALSAGLAAGDLRARMEGNDLRLTIAGTAEGLLIKDYAGGWVVRDQAGVETDAQAVLDATAQAALAPLALARADHRSALEASIAAKYLSIDADYRFTADGRLTLGWQQGQGTALSGSISGWETTITTTFVFFDGRAPVTSTVTESVPTTWATFSPNLVDSIVTLDTAQVASDAASISAGVALTERTANSYIVGAAAEWNGPRFRDGKVTSTTIGGFLLDSDGNATALRTVTTLTKDFGLGSIPGRITGLAAVAPPSEELFPDVVNVTFTNEQITERVVEITGGASSNTIQAGARAIVDAGEGDDTVRATGTFGTAGGFLYGNAGADTLFGGAGNDALAGGAGDDTTDGANGADTYLVIPDEAGFDIIDDTGNNHIAEPEVGNYSRYFEWYYAGLGIDNPFAAPQPLPALPRIAANNFSGLESLYAAGVLETDTVQFAAGVNLSDLSLSWGQYEKAAASSGGGGGGPSPVPGPLPIPGPAPTSSPYATLDISWAADRGVRIVIPHSENPEDMSVLLDPNRYIGGSLGVGIERFRFGDGTVLSMADMIARAPARPSFDPHITTTVTFDAGAGVQTLDAVVDTVAFGTGITPEMLTLDLGSLLIRVGDTGDALRVTRFDAQDVFGTRAVNRFRFADGTTLTYEQVLARGFDLNGTAGNDAISGTNTVDRVRGGAGNDTLSGAAGDDTYLFSRGDGADTVTDSAGTDRLALGDGLAAESTIVRQAGTGFVLDFGGGDTVTMSGVESVDFADGASWDAARLAAQVNDAPVLASLIADQIAAAGAPFALVVPEATFQDADVPLGDVLAYSAEGLPGWLAFDAASRSFSGTPQRADIGNYTVRLVASDREGASAQDEFTIEVLSVNEPPYVAIALPDVTALEDAVLALALPAGSFADPDVDDVLSYGATLADGSSLPQWLSFDASAQAFSGTPRQADVGTLDIRVTATDGAGEAAADLFRLTIENVNDAPLVAQPLADRSFAAGAPFAFAVPAGTFADEDAGDAMTLSASLYSGAALPAWLTFDPATGTFAGAPQAANVGITHVAVTATDAAGAAASSDFGLIVRTADGATHTGSAGDDVIYGGDGNETLIAKGGSDYVFGDAGNDLLRGGAGNDVLQGGAGDDVLRAGTGSNLLEGGAGNDLIYGGQGSGFIAGGLGDDVIRTGRGRDVIGFNRGDGADTVYSDREGDNTLSLGGGIRYEDLRFRKSGKDLVLETGGSDSITFKHWYSGQGRTSLLNIQIVTDAMEGFDESSTEPLSASRVNTFDAAGLVAAFDAARASDPYLTSWALSEALAQFHRWGSDDAAIGGDMAYWYGRNRGLGGLSLQSAQQVIGAAGFGSDAQTLRPFSGLQEGLVKLA